ncbi:MAG: CvpA family protein [Phototrophicaceae bacterium]
MIQLSVVVYLFVAFFAYVGWLRGWTKEVISLAGIMLAIFALWEFRGVITGVIFNDLPPGQVFYIQSALFIAIVFFAYQTRALQERAGRRNNREELQTKVLGGIVGAINGYLISGTLWFFLDYRGLTGLSANYPLAPLVVAPSSGSVSADLVQNLPVYLLTGTGGDGALLSLVVVVLFVVVLILI